MSHSQIRLDLTSEELTMDFGLRGKTALITGASKRAALAQWQAGEFLPVTTITAQQRVIVLTDTAATA